MKFNPEHLIKVVLLFLRIILILFRSSTSGPEHLIYRTMRLNNFQNVLPSDFELCAH